MNSKIEDNIPNEKDNIPKEKDNIPKKRGRKKKWESVSFTNNNLVENNEVLKFSDNDKEEIDEMMYNTNNVKFGNLFIKVHDKEVQNKETLFLQDTDKNKCLITVSSDEEDNLKIINVNNTKKKLNIYTKKKYSDNNVKCYNCHSFFENSPFYLPVDYLQQLDRYKLYGNFCSPNCVKRYCISNKNFESKLYLVGQFYRKLFGNDFKIKPAPSHLSLKDYGGNLTIEEFRKSFYNNNRYTLTCVNSKVIKQDIIF